MIPSSDCSLNSDIFGFMRQTRIIKGKHIPRNLTYGALIILLIHMWRKIDKNKYGLQPIFDGKLLKRLFYLSVWSMLHSFISMAPWFLFFIAIEHLGKMELAVSNITRSVSTLFFCDCQFFRSHQRFLGKQSFRSRTTKRCFSYLPQNHQNGICHRFSAGRSRIVL